MTDAEDNERFVREFANPHSWLLTAENLHGQATEIYQLRHHSGFVRRLNADGDVMCQTRDIDKPVFLLGGFALENAIKAFLVYENPQWVSNGTLAKNLRSHSLTVLQKLSKLAPCEESNEVTLREFESGLDSWFRYPCALTIGETVLERQLSEELWSGYLSTMRAYGQELVALLGKGWNGPHGWDPKCKWTITGDCLGFVTPIPAEYYVPNPPKPKA